MRIVLGIDHGEGWKSASHLLTRLRFREAVVDPVHSVEPPSFHLGEPLTNLPALLSKPKDAETAGLHLAQECAALLSKEGVISGAASVVHGSAAAELMKYAERVHARLIAVGSSGKSSLRSFFIGSVGRGLLIGSHQSILVARGTRSGSGPLRAVLATDHSAYANRCIDALLDLAPGGISHLTLLTVYPKEALEALRPFLPDFVIDPAEWIEQGLEKRNTEIMEKLKPLGCTFDSRVKSGTVHESIRQTMEEAQADLLILGAQGHGFVDRLTLGSVSFHEAIAEPHSVMVLRATDGLVSHE